MFILQKKKILRDINYELMTVALQKAIMPRFRRFRKIKTQLVRINTSIKKVFVEIYSKKIKFDYFLA